MPPEDLQTECCGLLSLQKGANMRNFRCRWRRRLYARSRAPGVLERGVEQRDAAAPCCRHAAESMAMPSWQCAQVGSAPCGPRLLERARLTCLSKRMSAMPSRSAVTRAWPAGRWTCGLPASLLRRPSRKMLSSDSQPSRKSCKLCAAPRDALPTAAGWAAAVACAACARRSTCTPSSPAAACQSGVDAPDSTESELC